MAPPVRTSRRRWIDAGLEALADGGPDAVRVEPIAAALGVTRGGFYGQFASRRAYLEALLDAWEHAALDEARAEVERRGGDVTARVLLAGALTFREELLPVELAVRNWARRDPAVAERLRLVDNERMALLREYFARPGRSEREVEGRAVLAFSLAIGHHFLAADHGGLTRKGAVEAAFEVLL